MARWQLEPPDPTSTHSRYPKDIEEDLKDDEDGDEDSGDESKLPELAEAVVFLFQSKAFRQLQIRMRTESQLSSRDGQTIQSIREKVLTRFGLRTPRSQTATDFKGPRFRRALISVSWNPDLFLQQEYLETEQPNIKDIIAIIGGLKDAQATTCGCYVRQVWPLSGEEALNALQIAIDQPGQAHKCT